MKKYPKSYLSEEERNRLLKKSDMEVVCLAESSEATRKGDLETAWEWLSFVKLPASCLKSMKRWYGAEFIKEKGFDTSKADTELGHSWLS